MMCFRFVVRWLAPILLFVYSHAAEVQQDVKEAYVDMVWSSTGNFSSGDFIPLPDSSQGTSDVHLLEDALEGPSGDEETDPTLNSGGGRYCFSDSQCAPKFRCDRYKHSCESCVTEGRLCVRDKDCCSTDFRTVVCFLGRCKQRPVLGGALSRCHDDDDCMEGFCCARYHGENACQPYLKVGQTCTILAGGVDFSINHACPCGPGLLCRPSPGRSRQKVGEGKPRGTLMTCIPATTDLNQE